MDHIQNCISEVIRYSNKMLVMAKESKDRFVANCTDILENSPELSEGVIAESDARPRDNYLRENFVAMGFLKKIFPRIEHDNLMKLTKLTISGNAWNCCARQSIGGELFEKFFYFKYNRDFISTFCRVLSDDHFLFFDCVLEVLIADDVVIGATLKTKIFLEIDLIEIKIFLEKSLLSTNVKMEKYKKCLGSCLD